MRENQSVKGVSAINRKRREKSEEEVIFEEVVYIYRGETREKGESTWGRHEGGEFLAHMLMSTPPSHH